ncbi:MAG: TIGR04255 family protein [Verrucomicrobiota bacterium]|nr:TIGR04255 family protein [Verrucomicrobiota bacterium]
MKIDVTEQFKLLPKAPIVEAVIQIHARPEASWAENEIVGILRPKIPEYKKAVSRKQIRHQVKLNANQPPEAIEENLGWHGLVCQTEDGKHGVQFNRDGFIFHRFSPYQKWEQFFNEALRLWKIYLEIARPVEAQRIGLRFINKIDLPPKEVNFEDYIRPHPETPFDLELPFMSFFHQDTLAVPGYPYAINIIRTIQPPLNPQVEGLGLVVDIDAFTTQSFEIKDGMLEGRLTELRWLKNKAFFGSVTEKALELFQ